MATFVINPDTVEKGDNITLIWEEFTSGYAILLESVSGPGTISSTIGAGPSGTKTEQVVMDPSVWVLRLRQPTPTGEIISNEVTLTIVESNGNGGNGGEEEPGLLDKIIAFWNDLPWWQKGLVISSGVVSICGVAYVAKKKSK